MDPLFQKTSAAFDEGGSGGLLLNQLRCLDDSSELVLDSNTIVTGTEDTEPNSRRGTKPVGLRELRGKQWTLFNCKINSTKEHTFVFITWKFIVNIQGIAQITTLISFMFMVTMFPRLHGWSSTSQWKLGNLLLIVEIGIKVMRILGQNPLLWVELWS